MLPGFDVRNEPEKPLDLAGLPSRPLEAGEWAVAVLSWAVALLFGQGFGRVAASSSLGWFPFALLILAGFPLAPYVLALAGARFRTGPLARDSIHLPLAPDERWRLLNLGPVSWLGAGPLLAGAAAGYLIGAAWAAQGEPARLLAAACYGVFGAAGFELAVSFALLLPLRLLLAAIPLGTAFLFLMPLAFYLFMLTGGGAKLAARRETFLPFVRLSDSLYANPVPFLAAGICLYAIVREVRLLVTGFRLRAERLGTENEYLQSDSFLAAIGRMAAVRSSGDAAPVDLWSRLFRRGPAPSHEPAYDLLGPHAEDLHARMELVTFQRLTRNVTGQLVWRPLLALLPVVFILIVFYVVEGPAAFRKALPYLVSLVGGLSIGGAAGTAFLSGDSISNRFSGGLQSAIAGRGDPKLQPWTWMPGVNERLFSGTLRYTVRIALYAVPTGAALAGLFSALAILLTGSGARWPLWAAMGLGAFGAAVALLVFWIRTPLRTLGVYRFADRMDGFPGIVRTVVVWAVVLGLILAAAATGGWAVWKITAILGLEILGVVALVYLLIPLVLLSGAFVLTLFTLFERWRYRCGERDLEARAPALGLIAGSAAVRAGKR